MPGFQQHYPGSAPPGVPFTSQYPRQEGQYAFAQQQQPQHTHHFAVDNVPGRTVAGTYPPEASPGYVPSPTPYGQQQADQSYPAPYSMAPMPAEYTHVSPQMPRTPAQGHRQSVQLPYHHSPEPLEQTHHGYQHVALPVNMGGVQAQQNHYSQAYQYPAQTSAAESYKPAQMLSESEEVMQAADQDVLVWHKMASGMAAGDGERLRLMHHHQKPGGPRQADQHQLPVTSAAQSTLGISSYGFYFSLSPGAAGAVLLLLLLLLLLHGFRKEGLLRKTAGFVIYTLTIIQQQNSRRQCRILCLIPPGCNTPSTPRRKLARPKFCKTRQSSTRTMTTMMFNPTMKWS